MSESNQMDCGTETKQCQCCGETIVRTNNSSHNWKNLKRCQECKKFARAANRGLGGNEFWIALNQGEIPPEMKDSYRAQKKKVREMYQKKWSDSFNRNNPRVSLNSPIGL